MNQEENILATKEIPSLLKEFATPSIIAMIVGALYNIVDQIFIGNSVGVLGNAATNVSFPLVTLCLALSLLIGIGGAANFNLRQGEKKPEEAAIYMANSFTLIIIISLIVMVLVKIFLTPLLTLFGATGESMPYAKTYTDITTNGFIFLILTNAGTTLIRADGSPKYSMAATLVGCITNIILDPIFIFIFDWGMAGAAWATVIGQFLSALMVIHYIRDFRTVHVEKNDFKPRFKYMKNIVSLGSAPFLNQVSNLFVQILMNNSIVKYGEASRFGSTIPLAIIGIGIKVFMIFFSCVIGIAQGMQPIISYNYGAKNYDRVKDTFKLSLKVASVIVLVATILFQLFPEKILSLFGDGSQEYFEFGKYFFRIFLMLIILVPIQPLCTNLLTSIGKAKQGAFLSLTRQIIFFVPILLIMLHFFGLMGIIYTGPAADFVSFLISAYMAKREFKEMDEMEEKRSVAYKNV